MPLFNGQVEYEKLYFGTQNTLLNLKIFEHQEKKKNPYKSLLFYILGIVMFLIFFLMLGKLCSKKNVAQI